MSNTTAMASTSKARTSKASTSKANTSKATTSGATTSGTTTSGTTTSVPVSRRNIKLQEDILDAVTRLNHRRKEYPKKLMKVEAKILHHQLHLAVENSYIPSTDVKKMVLKYPLKKPLPKDILSLSTETHPFSAEKLTARVKELTENYPGIKKAMIHFKWIPDDEVYYLSSCLSDSSI